MMIKFPVIKEKMLLVLLHILVWGIMFALPVYIIYLESNHDTHFLWITYPQITLYAAIFYLNYFWLAPMFYLRKKKTLYFSVAILLVIFMATAENKIHDLLDQRHPPKEMMEFGQGGGHREFSDFPPPPSPGDRPDHKGPLKNIPIYNFLMTAFLISGFGLGLRVYRQINRDDRRRKETEKEHLNSELSFLKNQINPHFFFNTLNNIYSLVENNVEDAQKAILHLSKLMRYLLYETVKGNKPISQEIEFMKNFIEIMKLRLSSKVALIIVFPEEYPDVSIPPLLFLPFIENAFKHGISYRKPSFIKIMMKVTEQEIQFECTNSLGGGGEELFRSGPGIGLDNVKKRLALLYPDTHHLEMHFSEVAYDVVLTIQLSKK
jgi:two-component system, LytTR family, sensor kinase